MTSSANRGTTFSAFAGLNGVTGKKVSSLVWPADPARSGVTIGYNWTNNQSGFGQINVPNYHTIGPVAVFLESVHCNKKGWAINTVATVSGVTTQGLANVITAFGATAALYNNSGLKTTLQETRERQIDAGGSGNVIVFMNTGINDVGSTGGLNETAAGIVYQPQLKRIIDTYKTTWESLGYPENDLAFIVSVTHPTNPTDNNLDSIRVLGQNYAQTAPDFNTLSSYSNVLFADITRLGSFGITFGGLSTGNAFNGNLNFYENPNSVIHLAGGLTGGYSYLGELLIKGCLRYSTAPF
jgi:hypothetical protein